MAKPFTEWTVLPHGLLSRIDDRMLSVTGKLHMPPMGDVHRRMTIVRLADARLIVYSAIALDEAEMAALDEFGTVAYLIVPSALHRMDAQIWKQRYPAMTVVAPAGARAKIQRVVPVDATEIDFGDPTVRFVTVPGTKAREAALIVETPSGTTLIVNDLIFDLKPRPGVMGWLFDKIGMTGERPHLPGPVRMRLVDDKAALRNQLERWARMPHLERVIISHGDIIAREPRRALERIAHDLAA